MNDWFEENIAKLDPSVKNERYILNLQAAPAYRTPLLPFEPIEPTEFGKSWPQAKYIVMKNRFKPENITEFYKDEATKDNFEKAVSEIARKASKDDIVYIQLCGHGSESSFYFSSEWPSFMRYEDLNETLNQIKAKVIIVSILACRTSVESLAPFLEEGSCPRIIATYDGILYYAFAAYDIWKKELNTMDIDKNGYISIKEGFLNYVKACFEGYQELYDPNATYTLVEEDGILSYFVTRGDGSIVKSRVFFFDPNNIGNEIYLGDASIEDL